MNGFTRGIMFAVGIAIFGKGMYELGRDKGQKETLGVIEFITKVKESVKKEES